ncbi:MAG TPA: co-chaperone GroES [Coxiellaceae bacterium]|nr:co-chaperone GroES [Coxiellaceae bacterium]HBY55751.1 co-chaperone GroES [Coxiellaceae bacterium]
MSKIRPLRDRVVIKRIEEERTSAGGIVIPDTATSEKPTRGEVCFIGSGEVLKDGKIRPLEVKVGDKVLFGKYTGTEVKIDNKEYVIMREEDILAIVQ